MLIRSHRFFAAICCFLTALSQLALAQGPYRDSQVLAAIHESSLKRFDPKTTESLLRESVERIRKDADAQSFAQAQFRIVGPSQLDITLGETIHLSIVDLAEGEFRLNGERLSVFQYSSKRELREAIEKILGKTLNKTASVSSLLWDWMIPSAHAVVLAPLALLTMMSLTALYMSLETKMHLDGCKNVDSLSKTVVNSWIACEKDKRSIQSDPLAFRGSETKLILDKIESTKYISKANHTFVPDCEMMRKENRYRSSLGLYLTKESCDVQVLCNNAQELAQCLNEAAALSESVSSAASQAQNKSKPVLRQRDGEGVVQEAQASGSERAQ